MSRRPKPPDEPTIGDYIGVIGCFLFVLALLWLA
jgi:hypothetical protein